MLLETINSPADLRTLDARASSPTLAAGDPRLHRPGGRRHRRPPRLQPRRGRAHPGLHRVFDSPRDIILWDTGHQAYVHKILTGRRDDFATLRQERRAVGLPEPGRVRARLGREQPRVDDPLLRPRRWPQAVEPARRRPPGRGRHRRRLDDRRHGLRGAQQPRPLRQAGRHRPQRQRPLLRPTVSRLTESCQPAAAATRLRRRRDPARAGAARAARGRRPRLLEPAGPVRRRPRGARAARLLRDPGRPLHRPHRRPRHRRPRGGAPHTRPSSTGRSSSTSSPRRARATRRPRTTTRRTCTTRRCSTRVTGPPPGGRRRRATPQAFTEALIEEADARPEGDAITAAMPGPDRAAAVPGPLPRPLPRRRHRRAARGHHGGRHGHGRPAPGRRRLLHVPHPRLRPGQPRRRAARPAGRVRPRPGRHHRRRRPVPPRRARPGAVPAHPGHDGVRAVVGPGAAGDAPTRARPSTGPASIRWPRRRGPLGRPRTRSATAWPRRVRSSRHGERDVCILAVGKLVEAAEEAAEMLAAEGISATVWDVRVVKPLDPTMLADAARARPGRHRRGRRARSAAPARRSPSAGRPQRGRRPTRRPARCSACRSTYIPQAKPARSSPLGLDGRGHRRVGQVRALAPRLTLRHLELARARVGRRAPTRSRRPRFRSARPRASSTKPDRTAVTEADKAVEEAIRARWSRRAARSRGAR